ncbi:MAG: YbaB/EbfC family nucleoid-associated protein [Gemmatimonadales bacterium]
MMRDTSAESKESLQLRSRVERQLVNLDSALTRARAEATAGGGLVRVSVDGLHRVRELVIAPEAFELRDAGLLADLVMSAIAEAQRRVEVVANEATDGVIAAADDAAP